MVDADRHLYEIAYAVWGKEQQHPKFNDLMHFDDQITYYADVEATSLIEAVLYVEESFKSRRSLFSCINNVYQGDLILEILYAKKICDNKNIIKIGDNNNV